MGFLIFASILFLVLLWKLAMPSSSTKSSWNIAPSSTASTQRKTQYRTQRPSGTYLGPEDWQLKGISRNIFLYATEDGKVPVDGLPFAVLDLETTGLEPFHKHRTIEVSVALFSADAQHEQSFTSLINPGIPIDNVPYHGITDEDVKDAPSMEDVLPYILHLLSGRVVVTHNAPFEEIFLFHAAQRAGLPLNLFCAVDTLSLARVCLDIPNHKLVTICDYLGIELGGPHEAEADALATGNLFKNLRKRRTLYIPQMPPAQDSGSATRPRILIRQPKVLKGAEGYMANLLRLLPTSTLPVDSQSEAAYVDMLTEALADRKLVKEEATNLAKLAIEVGLSAQRARELNMMFLDGALTLAMEDSRLEAEELRNLKAMAKLLGAEGYFDNLKAEKKNRAPVAE